MGPPAIVFAAAATVTTTAIVHERNENKRDAREARDRLQREADELEKRRIREEAEKKRQLEEQKKKQEEELKRLEEEQKRQKELERKRIEELKKQKELEEKKIEEEKVEKERIRQKKINEANQFYENEKKNYENNKFKQIINDFQNSMKTNFCSNQVNILEELIKKEINNIFKNYDSIIQKKTEEIYLSNLQNIKKEKDKKYRILLIGRTGVGKSTLINSIFDYDLAETGIGRPITMYEKPKKYEHYNREELELFDTRGIELDPKYGIEKTTKMVEEFVNDQLKKTEPLKAIWYCVTGSKIENIELNLIKKLRSLYKDDSLPVIIVYTQCIDDILFSQFKDYLKSQLNNQIIIKNILAKMRIVCGINCKRYGLEELLNETKEIIQKNNELIIISTAKIKANENMENIINEKINIESNNEFIKKVEKIILSFTQRLGQSFLDQNIINLIKSFYTLYTKKSNEIIKDQLEEIINKEAQIMKNDLSNILTNVIKKYGNIISINQNNYYSEYQNKINKELSGIANEYGTRNLNSNSEKFIKNEIQIYIQSKIKSYISSI